ncbi:MAG: Ig-like domain-containing protein, partial [Verrucomicrobiia bacterium]
FTLKQGTTAVTGTVSYVGVTAIFTPATGLAPLTTYTATITTGARDLAGNALATAFVWSFTTGTTTDTTRPTVSFIVPANAATGVAIGGNIAAAFSEAMDPLTISTATFTLKQGTTVVTGTVTYAGVTATFNPLNNLAPSTTYTATITTGARDLAGNALAAAFVWSFETGATPNTTPPTVSSTVPANAATGVAIGGNIAAVFSEAMDPLTISTATFTLKQGTTVVTGTVTYAGVTATFNPLNNLAPLTTYTATITTGARDLAGNALATAFVWSFTTGAAPDTTRPTVSSTIPTNAATGVAISGKIAAVFSEAMDPLTISTASFTLKQGTMAVTGTVSYAGVTATFNPTTDLAPLTTYTATITTGAKDLASNALATNFVWSFTTGTTPDTTPPTVSSTVPANGASDVSINQTINATFSEDMDPLTISTANFMLTGPGATAVTGTVTYVAAGKIATFTPMSNLAPGTTYTAMITTGAKDLAGNALAADYVWSFSTGTLSNQNQATINLGSASTFAIMATAAISGGGDQINGDVGLDPGSAQGIPPSEINGTIHVNDQAIKDAQTALLAAYNDAVSRSVNAQTLEGNLGGLTKTPGLYVNGSSTGISGTGTGGILTLDAQGDANAVFIFKMASTLVTDPGTSIVLSGGAQAKNVYWQVGSSATLGTTSIFKGNILAFVTITVNNGAAVEGRLFAGSGGDASGAVTVQSSTITVPAP